MLDRSLRNPINWAFARPLKVLATLGNRFFAGVGEVKSLIETIPNPQQSWGESCTQVAMNEVP